MPATLSQKWLSSKMVVNLMTQTMAKTKDKELRSFIFEQHHKHFSSFHSPTSVAEAFDVSINHNVREFAANITTPTLLIAGEKDDITPLEKQKELQKLFPHAELKIIDKVGHLTHYETPDQIAAFVEGFTKLS